MGPRVEPEPEPPRTSHKYSNGSTPLASALGAVIAKMVLCVLRCFWWIWVWAVNYNLIKYFGFLANVTCLTGSSCITDQNQNGRSWCIAIRSPEGGGVSSHSSLLRQLHHAIRGTYTFGVWQMPMFLFYGFIMGSWLNLLHYLPNLIGIVEDYGMLYACGPWHDCSCDMRNAWLVGFGAPHVVTVSHVSSRAWSMLQLLLLCSFQMCWSLRWCNNLS